MLNYICNVLVTYGLYFYVLILMCSILTMCIDIHFIHAVMMMLFMLSCLVLLIYIYTLVLLTFLCQWKMSGRDGQPPRRRGEWARQRSSQQHSIDDFQGDQPFSSLLESLLDGGETSSFMPTPQYDPRYTFSFFDQHQIPPVNQETAFPSTQVGDTSLSSTPNLPFFKRMVHIYRITQIWFWV